MLVGPSGTGKSTFLRCCNGLEVPEGGTIEICGKRLIAEHRFAALQRRHRLGTQHIDRRCLKLRREIGLCNVIKLPATHCGEYSGF